MVYEIDNFTHRVIIVRGLEELLGYAIGEVPSTIDWWISQIHPDDISKAQEQFYPTKSIDGLVNQYRVKHKDDGYIVVEGIAKVLKDKSGKTTKHIGSMQNITESKKLEKMLQEKNA